MEIDAGTGTDQIVKIVERSFEPLGHRVRAAVLDGRAHIVDPMRCVLRAQPAVVEPIEAQIVVVLEIVNRSDPAGVRQPADISLTGIFTDQQFIRDYADRRPGVAASWPRVTVVANAEPVNHHPNVTNRRASIPASP